MSIHHHVIGIDVSKHNLDIFDHTEQTPTRIANTATAITTFVAGLGGDDRFVVFEATGIYDAALRQTLDTAGLRYSRVNPSQARNFAKAAGFLAKTDPSMPACWPQWASVSISGRPRHPVRCGSSWRR